MAMWVPADVAIEPAMVPAVMAAAQLVHRRVAATMTVIWLACALMEPSAVAGAYPVHLAGGSMFSLRRQAFLVDRRGVRPGPECTRVQALSTTIERRKAMPV